MDSDAASPDLLSRSEPSYKLRLFPSRIVFFFFFFIKHKEHLCDRASNVGCQHRREGRLASSVGAWFPSLHHLQSSMRLN